MQSMQVNIKTFLIYMRYIAHFLLALTHETRS